jgi:holin-like protein
MFQDLPMTHHPLHPLQRFFATSRVAQISVLVAFWAGGCAVTRLAGIPVPGSFIGLLALLGLLLTGAVEPRLVERGAAWLLAEMLLFFVPAVVAVLAHPEFLGLTGLKVLLVILVSTVMVMLATAATVELGMRWMAQRAAGLPQPQPGGSS